MIQLDQYESLAAALRASLDQWSSETCLIEADRERENCRMKYSDFKAAAMPVAGAMQVAGFAAGDRAAIVMGNQSKWLISAYAVFYSGGVLVPLDYKLTAQEQFDLLQHCRATVLFTEYYLWRAIAKTPSFGDLCAKTVFVTDAPPNTDLFGARRWEEAKADRNPEFVPRKREDPACIVYSSGTGGRPKGCMLTHSNYLEQCQALVSLYPFSPGVRYLSILPTNHAIDFMVGFIGPFVCGATVVHLRTLRPEFIREAFTKYRITYMALVPLVLKNLEAGLKERFARLSPLQKFMLDKMIALNRSLTRNGPNVKLSRMLLGKVHEAFGGELRAFFVGGAFTEPSTLQFFYDLGIPVANGYGLTEAGTAITLNDLHPFRSDTVGKPLPGMEVRIVNPEADGVGEVAVRGKTIMSHYLDDPELTAETIVNGWLMTGDLGRIDAKGHLQLFGRKKNMIVTEGGKNIYPEDIEKTFEGLPVKEFCIFAANYLWPRHESKAMLGEQLVIVLRFNPGAAFTADLHMDLTKRNQRLPDFKRVGGCIVWDRDFPRTASMKIKRNVLAEEIGKKLDRATAVRHL